MGNDDKGDTKLIEDLKKLEEARLQRFGANIWLALVGFAYIAAHFVDDLTAILPKENTLSNYSEFLNLFSHLLLSSIFLLDFLNLYLGYKYSRFKILRTNWFPAFLQPGLLANLYLYILAPLIVIRISGNSFPVTVLIIFGSASILLFTILSAFKAFLNFADLDSGAVEAYYFWSLNVWMHIKKKYKKTFLNLSSLLSFLFFVAAVQELTTTWKLCSFKNIFPFIKVLVEGLSLFWIGFLIIKLLQHIRGLNILDHIYAKVLFGEYNFLDAFIRLEGKYLGESLSRYMDLKWQSIFENLDLLLETKPKIPVDEMTTIELDDNQKNLLKQMGIATRNLKLCLENMSPEDYEDQTQVRKFLKKEWQRYDEMTDKLRDQINASFNFNTYTEYVEGFMFLEKAFEEFKKEKVIDPDKKSDES